MIADTREGLLSSLRYFTQVFYKIRTGRKFEISTPPGRESHYITIWRALEAILRGDITYLGIEVPPRYGKSEMVIHFVAWALAHYPDANFLFTSYSHSLAKKQTQTIKQIVTLSEYRQFFDVHLSKDTSAKDNFETTASGSVYAAGAGGTITGRGAGIQNATRFGGAIVIDDIHKPDEVTSDTMRESVVDWYLNTLHSRTNSPNTPIIYIGQRLHEADLASQLHNQFDGHPWQFITLPALDVHTNPLHPTMHSRDQLLSMQDKMPYVFASQYQQNPIPAGGGLFKEDWFKLLDIEPEIITTFITVDGAESLSKYADYTVFSFFGVYKIKVSGVETDLLALHWLDCLEDRIEPKDIQAEFLQFWQRCMSHRVKPTVAAIEKKSSGTHLCSVLKGVAGLRLIEVERTRESGNKTARFLAAQPYVASNRVTLPTDGDHTVKCVKHMTKITANETHRHDDIADTLADGIKLALADQVIYNVAASDITANKITTNIQNHFRKIDDLKRRVYGR